MTFAQLTPVVSRRWIQVRNKVVSEDMKPEQTIEASPAPPLNFNIQP